MFIWRRSTDFYRSHDIQYIDCINILRCQYFGLASLLLQLFGFFSSSQQSSLWSSNGWCWWWVFPIPSNCSLFDCQDQFIENLFLGDWTLSFCVQPFGLPSMQTWSHRIYFCLNFRGCKPVPPGWIQAWYVFYYIIHFAEANDGQHDGDVQLNSQRWKVRNYPGGLEQAPSSIFKLWCDIWFLNMVTYCPT